MKKIKIFLLSFVTALSIGGITLSTAPVFASTQDEVCQGIGAGSGGSDCNAPSDGPTVNGVIKATINILSIIVGVAAVIMIIVGGLRYVMANGSDSSISGAKNTILYAIIGLVVAAAAQIIVRFVLARTTK